MFHHDHRAIALLANTTVTGGALVAILLVFGPISARAHEAGYGSG